MKPHKWAKEIKAWADGAKIEIKWGDGNWSEVDKPSFNIDENVNVEYRIKPQQKEPQYLYVYERIDNGNIWFSPRVQDEAILFGYLGKIKLEVDDE